MADTHGFEVVIEAGRTMLRKVLRGAWKSALCPVEPGDEGRIPEFLDISETDALKLGDYLIKDGQVQIPQEELDANPAPDVNGAEWKLGLHIQLEVESPPVPAARLFDLTADVFAKVPVGTVAGSKNVYFLIDNLPRGNVRATLTSGDPLAPKLDTILQQYVHSLYEANGPSFPHTIAEEDVTWPVPLGSVQVDAYTELYDDELDPPHRVEVSRITATGNTLVRISIPLYLRIFNIRKSGSANLFDIRDPMGIVTRLSLLAPLESPPGSYTARMTLATVTVDPLMPAPGQEGLNYVHNKGLPFDIDAALTNQIRMRGVDMAKKVGDFTIKVPTVAQIELMIGDLFHKELAARDRMAMWTPEGAEDVEFSVNDVTTKALTNVLVIALNKSDGADIDGMGEFLPADRDFAIALSAAQVDAQIRESRERNELKDSDLPKRISKDGKDIDLRSLSVFLVAGAIRIEGDVTVVDAVLDSIDVDASFRADVGLEWVDNPDGTQRINHFNIGDPDVDPEESIALWLITIIAGLLTFGVGGAIVGALIALVVQLIVSGIATSIGGALVKDEITGAVVGFGGWPTKLTRIGRVQTRFANPITIETTGLVMSGTVEVVSSCEATAVVAANSGSSYLTTAASTVLLKAQNLHADAGYRWLAGDGTAEVLTATKSHKYAASGYYIAKHGLQINQPGGASSRHFALIQVKNVRPTVDAGPDRVVHEGELVTLVGRFWDVEYPDTHESSWVFGDHQLPQPGKIEESNAPPRAVGTSTVQHAWCDNGDYEVTLRVRDQNGGMATDTLRVKVLNVSPQVDAGRPLYAYCCTVITLTGRFVDPGWCDTHRGFWDFGDCSPRQTAIIRETNEAPAAKGTVVASHIYRKCGTFQVECTVLDDDGASGVATTTVEVVTLANAGFEEGFHGVVIGKIANGWEPYAVVADQRPEGVRAAGQFDRLYDCEECIVHGGVRSQYIAAPPRIRLGILQKLGANPDWDYQISAWYSMRRPGGGTARLGIDPEGGTNPSSSSIVWNTGKNSQQWAHLAERVTAKKQAITIFLDFEATDRNVVEGFFDDVEFVAIQPHCIETPSQPPEQPAGRCVDFRELKPSQQLDTYVKDGFRFNNLGGQPIRVIDWGQPLGLCKLLLTPRGLEVTLPWPAARIAAEISYGGGKPVQVRAFNNTGAEVAAAVGTSDPMQTIEVVGTAMLLVVLTGQEAGLYRLCADPDRSQERPPGTRVAIVGADVARLSELWHGDRAQSTSGRKSEIMPDSTRSRETPMDIRQSLNIDAEGWNKLSPNLQRALQQPGVSAETVFPVLISIQGINPDLPRQATISERAARLHEEFQRETRTLTRVLERLGAESMEHLWISRAISARISLDAIAHLARDETIKQIILMEPMKLI